MNPGFQAAAYACKAEIYQDQESILTYVPQETAYIATFKTPEFVAVENVHQVLNRYSMRSTDKFLPKFNITIPSELSYKIATCVFSENGKTLGIRKHFHLPDTRLPTITIGKKLFQGKDDVRFNFYRKNAPPDIQLKKDFVLRFNSSRLPHEVVVKDQDQSVWLFIVIEHCSPIDLEFVRQHFGCEEIYDYA